jgi:RNA polymerase sigma factor (sigma-70 family)
VGWLFQVVRNECIRRSKIALRLHRPRAGIERSAEEVAIDRLELTRIAESIARLEPDQRAVLVLRDVEGLSGGDAAERLGLTRAAMKSRLHRARESFRLQLEQDGGGPQLGGRCGYGERGAASAVTPSERSPSRS